MNVVVKVSTHAPNIPPIIAIQGKPYPVKK